MKPKDRVYFYRCPYCTKRFLNRSSGVAHIRENHRKRVYDQSYTTASFFNREAVWQKAGEELESAHWLM